MSDAGSVLDDPRWRRFNTTGFTCSCGQNHVGLFPIQVLYPIGWAGSKTYEPDAALRMDGNFLSANFCVLEGKYFSMRMRLPIQIRGAQPAAFMFTVWASLERPDFEGYVAAMKAGTLQTGKRAPARLVNRLNGYPETARLLGTAFQEQDGAPGLIIHDQQPDGSTGHPLYQDQRHGIGLDRALELFSLYDHDMRLSAR